MVPKLWAGVVLAVLGKAALGAEVRDVKVLTFARHGPSVARRTRLSDPRTARLAANRKLVFLEAPKTEAPATPNLRRSRPKLRRVSAQRISRRLAPASLAHRAEGLVAPAGLVQEGAEGLAAPVDLEGKAEGSVAPAGSARLMVAAVSDEAALPIDHKAMRSPSQRTKAD